MALVEYPRGPFQVIFLPRPAPLQVALGNALWGFPQSYGYAPAAQHAPDSWKHEFFSQPGAGVIYLGLFKSCRSGRDLALLSARSATWRFNCAAPQDSQALARQLTAAKRCLALRRGGRTCVELTCDGSPATSAALWALSTHFGGAVAAVSDLKVVTTAHYPHNTVEGFVRFAAPMLFPNLNTLTLIGDAHPLPPPAQLPRLAAVAVSCVPLAEGRLDAMVTSFAPYLPQLTVLHVSKVGGPAVTWGPLFTPSNKSQALRVFSTSERLSEQLLSGLLSHAPALKQLSVGSLAGAGPMGIRDHSKESWAVEQLHVGDLTGQASAGCVATLMRLPRSTAAGRVQVTTGDGWTLMPLTAQGLYKCVSDRLPEFDFTLTQLRLVPMTHIATDDHPLALRRALRQLGQLRAPAGYRLLMDGLSWSPDMAEDVSCFAVMQPRVTYRIDVGVLTDSQLAAILQITPSVDMLTVALLNLQSDQPAGAAWPWRQLLLTYTPPCLSGLLRLPSPAAASSPAIYTSQQWAVSASQAEAGRLRGWLPHVRLGALQARPLHFTVHGTKDTTLLRARLSVLQAVQFVNPAQTLQTSKLHVDSLIMTTDTMAALTELPRWGGELVLWVNKWPLPAAGYKTLASYIPTTYSAWRLQCGGGGSLDEGIIESICAGVKSRRAGLGLPPLVLSVRGEGIDRMYGQHVSLKYVDPSIPMQ